MVSLSIVVPVYNVEKYLCRCIDSLLNQKIENYEIIIVDDESSDNSGKIADEYSSKYNFIKVIHQKNKGLSGARNTGLKIAQGKYLMFVDSDDFIKENCCSYLIGEMEKFNLDIGVADFCYYENNIYIPNDNKPYHCNSVVDGLFFLKKSLKLKSPMMVWKSIYKKSFLLDNNLFFLEGYNHEDEHYTPLVYINAQRVKDIECIFYNYFINDKGISKKVNDFRKNSIDLIKICYILKEKSTTILDVELKKLFQNNIAFLFLSAFYKGKLIGSDYEQYVNSSFFENLWISGYTKKKVKLFRFNKYLYYYTNYCLKKFLSLYK